MVGYGQRSRSLLAKVPPRDGKAEAQKDEWAALLGACARCYICLPTRDVAIGRGKAGVYGAVLTDFVLW
jgi:hypothetical protein